MFTDKPNNNTVMKEYKTTQLNCGLFSVKTKSNGVIKINIKREHELTEKELKNLNVEL